MPCTLSLVSLIHNSNLPTYYNNQFNYVIPILDEVLKTVDPRFNRPGKGNLKDYLLGLREPPLAPLKGTSASLCKAFADSFDHALYGYKVSYKSRCYLNVVNCHFHFN